MQLNKVKNKHIYIYLRTSGMMQGYEVSILILIFSALIPFPGHKCYYQIVMNLRGKHQKNFMLFVCVCVRM